MERNVSNSSVVPRVKSLGCVSRHGQGSTTRADRAWTTQCNPSPHSGNPRILQQAGWPAARPERLQTPRNRDRPFNKAKPAGFLPRGNWRQRRLNALDLSPAAGRQPHRSQERQNCSCGFRNEVQVVSNDKIIKHPLRAIGLSEINRE
jgi:hypothetical protein